MYDLEIKPDLDKIFKKLAKKNIKQLEIINKKIVEIRNNPTHGYKYLKKPLAGLCRIHIDAHFVLVFKIDHEQKLIVLYYYDHHDRIYNIHQN